MLWDRRKEDLFEHDEGSLYAGSAGDVTEAASECGDDDTAGKKKLSSQSLGNKDQKQLDLNLPGD